MLSFGPKGIVVKLEGIPMVCLRSGGGNAAVKQDIICARDSHLWRVQSWVYTERFVRRGGIVWGGAGWASLSGSVQPEARLIYYVRGSRMGLPNRRAGV